MRVEERLPRRDRRPLPLVIDPTGNPDGEAWAKAFMERFGVQDDGSITEPMELDDVRGWFANAIETGITEGEKRQRERHEEERPKFGYVGDEFTA